MEGFPGADTEIKKKDGASAIVNAIEAIGAKTVKVAKIAAVSTIGFASVPQAVNAQKVAGEHIPTAASVSPEDVKEKLVLDPRLYEFQPIVTAIQNIRSQTGLTIPKFYGALKSSEKIADIFFEPGDIVFNGEIVQERYHVHVPDGFNDVLENTNTVGSSTRFMYGGKSYSGTAAHHPELSSNYFRIPGNDLALAEVTSGPGESYVPLGKLDLNNLVVAIGRSNQYVGVAFSAKLFTQPIGSEKPLLVVNNAQMTAGHWPVDFEKLMQEDGTYCMVLPSTVDEDLLRSGTGVVQVRKDESGKEIVEMVGTQSTLAEIYFNDPNDKVSSLKTMHLMCFVGSERIVAGVKQLPKK